MDYIFMLIIHCSLHMIICGCDPDKFLRKRSRRLDQFRIWQKGAIEMSEIVGLKVREDLFYVTSTDAITEDHFFS